MLKTRKRILFFRAFAYPVGPEDPIGVLSRFRDWFFAIICNLQASISNLQ
jgi:hypothetical protein